MTGSTATRTRWRSSARGFWRAPRSCSSAVVELADQRLDAACDLLAQRAHVFERTALGVGKVPVDVALAREVRAAVAAAHRDDHISALGEFVREPLRAA